nr:ankyrin repeat domain-containing protein [Endozoicomonas sp. YOMI1]
MNQYHLNCIPRDWFERMLMQRECSICQQPNLQLLRNNNPLDVDICRLGDLETLNEILRLSPNFDSSLADYRNADGNTALHLAALCNQTETVVELLKINSNLAGVENNHGKTALYLAALNGQTESAMDIFNLYFATAIDIGCTPEDRLLLINNIGEAYEAAEQKDHTDIAEKLRSYLMGILHHYLDPKLHLTENHLEEVADKILKIDSSLARDRDSDGDSFLDIVAHNGHTGTIRLLLDIDPSLATGMNEETRITPLHHAANGGYLQCLELLIEKGADINASNHRGRTPFHAVVIGGNDDLLELFKKRADIDTADNVGNTPLHFAAEMGDLVCVKKLLANGANIVRNKERDMPIDLANREGHIACKDLLQEKQADIELANKEVMTPKLSKDLCAAAMKDDIDELKRLISRTVNVNIKDKKDGKTALHYAAEKGSKKCLEHLIKEKADIHCTDNSGKTALHFAAENGHTECLKYLISEGADINRTDKDGKSVLHYAIENEMQNTASKETCLDYLPEKSVDFSASNIFRVLKYAINNEDHLTYDPWNFFKIRLCVRENNDKHSCTTLQKKAINI